MADLEFLLKFYKALGVRALCCDWISGMIGA